jgi:hypothetical protein
VAALIACRTAKSPQQAACDPVIQRIVCAMVPGSWHSRGDLMRAIGGGRGDRCRLDDTLRPRGLVKRALNSAWVKVGKYDCATGQRDPKWVYKLTEAGEQFRECCLLWV